MSDDSTTTTTTGVPTTSTTTTESQEDRDRQEAETRAADLVQAQEEATGGEVAVDKDAEAHVLKEQSSDERLSAARHEALANHAAEHADDDGDVSSRDKTEE